MKVLALSDTHEKEHLLLNDPIYLDYYDLVLVGGDVTGDGCLFKYEQFLKWLNTICATHKIIIAGNHDFQFYLPSKRKEALELTKQYNCIYLEDQLIEIDGKRIYGFPWTPVFFNWAFMLERKGEQMQRNVNFIPENLDILLTHGPCYSILDSNKAGHLCGCETLKERVELIKPKYHLFGHIHSYNKEVPREYITASTTYYNISICDERNKPISQPRVFDI
jgi:Icc-related predicted phosphoesterase